MRRFRTALLGVFIAVCGGPLTAATWVVDQGGMGDFTTITDAVASASASDTIWVRPGTYVDWVKFLPDKEGILLKGDGPVESIIIENDTAAVSVAGTVLPVRIENLTLTGSRLTGAVFITGAKAEIIGCVIRDNVGPGDGTGVGGGGRIQMQSDVLVEGCLFENNHSWESPGGLIVWSSRADIRKNTFVGNGGEGGTTIWVLGGSPYIHHNIIVDSYDVIYCHSLGDWPPLEEYPPSTPVFEYNICWNITNDLLPRCVSSVGMLVTDPLFCDAAGGSFGLCADSPAGEGDVAVYGAFGVECAACGEVPVMNKSWGGVKSLFKTIPAEND